MWKIVAACCLSIAMLSSRAETTGWERTSPLAAGLDPSRLEALEAAILSGSFSKIGSVLIAHHGKLVYEHYWQGDEKTLRDTRSATKSITGALVGLAIAQHSLSGVDAKILSILPERAKKISNPDPRKANITVEDFLTMSSVLECDDWNEASRGNEERMYLVEDWAQFVLDLPVRGHMRIGTEPEQPKYQRWFSYCTGGVFTLSEVIAKSTGRRTDLFAQTALFDPMGIVNSQWVYSPLGVPQTGGGLRLSSQDLLKFAQLYLDHGVWQGRQLLPAEWIARSIQPRAKIDETTEFGYLWWLKTLSLNGNNYFMFYMSGNGGNKVVAIPQLDLAAVITSTNYNTRGMHEATEKILVDFILAPVL
jgi:CubicO group peptidase (beta-lactamase class C family)